MSSFIFTLTSELKELLSLFAKEAGKKNESYPEAVLVDGKVLSAANAYVSLKYQMGTDELGMMPETFDSPVLIPIKGVRAIIDSPTNSEITVKTEGNTLSIHKKGKKAVLNMAAITTNFPDFGKFEVKSIDKISIGDFIDAVNSVKHSISDNNAKPIYTGLLLNCEKDSISFSAIDGIRGSVVKLSYESESSYKISIPRNCIDTIIAAVAKKDISDTLSIVRGKDNRHAAFFIGSRLVVRTRLLDGEPMDVYQMCGTQPINLLVDKAEIISVLKSISTILEDNHNAITLEANNGEVLVGYRAGSVNFSDSISYEMESGDITSPFRIGVNVKYLTEAIKSIGSKKIRLGLRSSLKPIILSDTEGKDNRQIVVPVRISE